jgi:hypothetical protein
MISLTVANGFFLPFVLKNQSGLAINHPFIQAGLPDGIF